MNPLYTATAPATGESDAALALVNKAFQVCPYADATRGNIGVALRVV